VKALKKAGANDNYDFQILNAVDSVNENQKTILLPKMEAHLGVLSGKKIAVWGLAFKPETDDIREAPSIVMMNALLERGAELSVFDPEAMPNIQKRFGDRLKYADSMYDALEDVDALLICTEWSIFRTPTIAKMKESMKAPVIFDGRNLYNIEDMEADGFTYISIGRRAVNS